MESNVFDTLMAHFDITATIRYKPVGRSYAYCNRRLLIISRSSPLGFPWVELHEFAHLVAEQAEPKLGHRHGHIFRMALLRVIETAGYTPSDYPWHQEYISIYKWAKRLGLSPLSYKGYRKSRLKTVRTC